MLRRQLLGSHGKLRKSVLNLSTVALQNRAPVVWTYLPNHVPYHLALLLQETLVANRLSARSKIRQSLSGDGDPQYSPAELSSLARIASTDILLLLQHTPVYTAGRRQKSATDENLEKIKLTELGADYVNTQRGGESTYHGPGQLVGYSIMDIAPAKLSVRDYVDRMETFLSNFTEELGVTVHPTQHTGVFTSNTKKIGSIGIHIRHRITLHGFSLNVEDQVLPWFNHIIACGLAHVSATSVETQVRSTKNPMSVQDTVPLAVKLFGQHYERDMVNLDEDQDCYVELRKTVEHGLEGKLPKIEYKM